MTKKSKRPNNRIRNTRYYANTKPSEETNSTEVTPEKSTQPPNMSANVDFSNLKCSKCGFVPTWTDSAAVPQFVIDQHLYQHYLNHQKICTA